MSMILKSATIHRYCCIESDQNFDVEPETTVLVGMNESGKTSILKALAKTNYHEKKDSEYQFETTRDYPRKLLKKMQRSGERPCATTLKFIIDDDLKKHIETELEAELSRSEIEVVTYYDNKHEYPDNGSIIDCRSFIDKKLKDTVFSDDVSSILSFSTISEFNKDEYRGSEIIADLKKCCMDKGEYDNIVSSYVYQKYIVPAIPKFMYYDEYFALPPEASIRGPSGKACDKTVSALFELADIDLDKVNSDRYEEICAELEATQMDITDELLSHWSSNKNLRFRFELDKVERTDNVRQQIVDHILKIRVENQRSGVSLPIDSRSKGFNWFFSFIVWFKKIQADKNNTYILLMDEPGLNLHAKAQNDLLKFIEDELSHNYQVIYTTHSPFMIDSTKIHNVRTVVEKEDGTHISDSIKEHDSDTLFPLQAALGYDIAQNLFISPKNLLVEGVADLIYLEVMGDILSDKGRVGLDSKITIVPIGGADKITTFISLLKGNKLDIVCLLDTINNTSLKNKLNSLKEHSIITDDRIIFYSDITNDDYSDVEDMFDREDYIKLYNDTFGTDVKISEINAGESIVGNLTKISGQHFNHFSPAKKLARFASEVKLSEVTLGRFESLFKMVNKKLN